MKLFVLPIETLNINKENKLNIESINFLNKIKEYQYQLVLTSSQSYIEVIELLDINNKQYPIIASNGNEVVINNEYIYCSQIEYKEEIKTFIKYLDEHHIIYQLYTKNNVYTRQYENMMKTLFDLSVEFAGSMDSVLRKMQTKYNQLYKDSMITSIEEALQLFQYESIIKIEVYHKDEKVIKDISKNTNLDYHLISDYTYMFTKKRVNILSGLKKLAKKLPIDENSIATYNKKQDRDIKKKITNCFTLNKQIKEATYIASLDDIPLER